MKKTVMSAAALTLALGCAAGCSIKEASTADVYNNIISASSTQIVSTTTLPPVSTTEPTTVQITTTVPETEPEPETEKTTKVKKTEKETAKQTKQIDPSDYGSDTKTRRKTYTEKLKYGVTVTKTVEEVYRVLSDGSEEILGENVVTANYARLGYSASYDDLLPAANKNRSRYDGYIEEIVDIINEWRSDAGLKKLKISSKLCEIASVRAEEVAWSGKHSHYRPNNKYFSSIFKENGFETGVVGENLGWGYITPREVCEAWKNSPTHYENIMNPDFTRIGVGVADDADPDRDKCWVQHFSSNGAG